MDGPTTPDAVALTDAVTRLRRALRTSVRADIAWETLPMAQVEVLQSLSELSPARVADLAERLHLAPSTVSGLVSQMLRAGLVERATDPLDRRAALITVAPGGRAQLAAWEQANARRIGAALRGLGDRDRRAISAAVPSLGRLAALLVADD